MKTNIRIEGSKLVIESDNEKYEARIDTVTGETTFDYTEGTIDEMHRFISTARNIYRRHALGKEFTV